MQAWKTGYHLHGDGGSESTSQFPRRWYPIFVHLPGRDVILKYKKSSPLEMRSWKKRQHLYLRDDSLLFRIASLDMVTGDSPHISILFHASSNKKLLCDKLNFTLMNIECEVTYFMSHQQMQYLKHHISLKCWCLSILGPYNSKSVRG